MFNAASRLACKDHLDKDMPDLVCVFDLLYHQSNVIWYQWPDGTWDKFLQDEGFTQGCPLSVLFACIVLHPILVALKEGLDKWADERLASGDRCDDGKGSWTPIGAYLNDITTILPFQDLAYAYDLFKELGEPNSLFWFWIHRMCKRGTCPVIGTKSKSKPHIVATAKSHTDYQNCKWCRLHWPYGFLS